MTPNIIGSSCILAEMSLANTDSNNNNKSAVVSQAASTASATCPTTKPIERAQQSDNAVVETNKMDQKTTTRKDVAEKKPYKMEIVWHNVFLFIILHSMALYGVYLVVAESAYIELVIGYLTAVFGGLGITAGVHRLWSHKAYKAKLPLRIFLMLCQSLAFQNSIWEWTRDHRVHHKFTDTDADPHNSRRGFFFAHMGWLLCKKHPDVKEKGKQIDMSDMDADPVVAFQKKYYFIVMPICCFVLPAIFPYFYLGSSLKVCFFVCSMLRYTFSLHGTWLVNSAAHFYGMKPYDVNISSVNSKMVSIIAFGEGWHNYHHVFPWDYKAAELGTYEHNWTTAFLDFMAKIGQAYDLKSVSEEIILKRVKRTGDGTHYSVADLNNNTQTVSKNKITEDIICQLNHENEETLVWGWDDTDISDADRLAANIDKKEN